MRWLARIVVLLLLPAVLTAQPPAADAASDGVMLAFSRFADIFGSRLVAAFEAIPAARYDYRPTPAQQTVGYVAQHLEDANYSLCERLVGQVGDARAATALRRPASASDSLADTVKARWPKDTLVARLRASLGFCHAALDRVSHPSAAHAHTLLAFETDLAEHYSQIAVYMRLLGLVPPSALPPAPRTAVALPVAELSRYVGRYRLAQGLELEVTLRDGALVARSNVGGGPVPLWPEGGSAFFVREADVQITFTRDAAGAVTRLVLHQYGRDRPGRKLR